MTKTLYELREADVTIAAITKRDPKVAKTKFAYVCSKFMKKNLNPWITEFNEKLADLRLEHALTVKATGAVVLNAQSKRGYDYTREGLHNLEVAERALEKSYNEKEVEIVPHITTEVPEGLTEEETEILIGLVI